MRRNKRLLNGKTAFVALGCNLGTDVQKLEVLETAVARLHASDQIEVIACSSVYRTPPWGVTDQPPFYNAVAELSTTLPPRELMLELKRLETRLGRMPGPRWGPRVIDLDLLLYDSATINDPDLVVPHPRMLERSFVVIPLLEVSPECQLPDGQAIQDAAASGVLSDAAVQIVAVGVKPRADD